ncbi:MAG: hypothetical protein AB8B57_03245 [Congregibacter sp.]
MDVSHLLTLLHLLLFCYWLGGDIGVFYSSSFVVDASLSREQRLMAGKIMLALDLVPRICMSLMLTIGGLLSAAIGFSHPLWLQTAILLLGPVWLSLVLLLHFRHGASSSMLTRLDRALRWGVILSIVASVVWTESQETLQSAPWLSAKLLGFALLVFCGLMIRRGFGGFAAGYAALVAREPTAAENTAMQHSLSRVRPWVLLIWVVLVGEAFLGIAQPGG